MNSITRFCKACGSEVVQKSYQMRAADEVSTLTWSCDSCPVDESRIRFSDPIVHSHSSYPRVFHNRSVSEPTYICSAPVRSYLYVELILSEPRSLPLSGCRVLDNVRHRKSVLDQSTGRKVSAHRYIAGAHAGYTVTVKEKTVLSPRCKVMKAEVYSNNVSEDTDKEEKEGTVRTVTVAGGRDAYLYSTDVSGKKLYSAVLKVGEGGDAELRIALVALHSVQQFWPDIRSFVSKDYLSVINNLSPRAWDSKRMQKKGAVYSPKVDGERAYVLVYQGVAHMFSKGKGNRHIGWRVLEKPRLCPKPVVVDVENTLSYGCFFIDMLTDWRGNLSPKVRDYAWSVKEVTALKDEFSIDFVSLKPYYPTLREAEEACSRSTYPTDGVVALWGGSTTARKMKQERSIELVLRDGGELATSDGDTVIEKAPLPANAQVGDVVEVRFKLSKDGRNVVSAPLFQRTDKYSANSTSAVYSVLESFSCVSRSDETRRRSVTVWCDSLKSSLVKEAVKRCGDRKIIMDVGTGTGQSLDALTRDKGVSYILVEPNMDKCEWIKRRAGVSKVWSDPRDVLSNIRHLKSGSQTYMVLCCKLSDLVSDEELMSSIHTEIGAVTATFSLHFVVAELYELSTYWSLPVVGCFYPYDGVRTGGNLVDTLGVKMSKVSETQCTVKWGGDREYTEPCTVLSEYQVFSSTSKATEFLQAPGPELDKEVFDICNKVYVVL